MRVLLIDEQVLFRHGLRLILSDLDPFEDVVEADSVDSATTDVVGPIDLVLLELGSDRAGGHPRAGSAPPQALPRSVRGQAVTAARHSFPKAIVVVVSGENDPTLVIEAIDRGAAGFIPKTSSAAVLISALRLVLVGGIYLPRHVLDHRRRASTEAGSSSAGRAMRGDLAEAIDPHPQLVDGFFLANEPGQVPLSAATASQLTRRQRQVLRLVVQGLPNKAIARELKVSESTIKQHLSSSFKLLGVNNRTQAVYLAAQLGLQGDGKDAGASSSHGGEPAGYDDDELSS